MHDPGRTTRITDAPLDNHGRAESFSPTDLVVASLGTCILTTMGIVANRDGIIIDNTNVYAEKHLST